MRYEIDSGYKMGLLIKNVNMSGSFRGTFPQVPPGPAPSPLPSGLQVHLDAGNSASYPGTGTTWFDLSGNNRNGAFFTGIGRTVTYTSNLGGGLSINGGGTVGVNYNLPLTAWSIEMVCSISVIQYWAGIWGNEVYNSNLGYFSYLEGPSALVVTRGGTYGGSFRVNPGTVNTVNYWTWVHTGTAYSVYKNGTLLTSSGTYTRPSSPATIGTVFGSRHTNSATTNSSTIDPINGTLYIIRMYDSALTSQQVTTNYNAIKSRFNI